MTRRIVTPGLAPSAALAPSATLAPADTIYGGAPITPHQVWMRVGAGGTLVDVSSWVEFGEGITYAYGRASQFDDAAPGTFTFTLNNSDGRFTPENPASPLATKVVEGMSVLWVLGTRSTAGHILAMEIPSDEATWHQLVITCDDMLGTAGRHYITTMPDAMLEHEGADLLWKLDESDGSFAAAETYKDGIGPFQLTRSNPASTDGGITFGVHQRPGLPGTAMTLTAAAGETNWFGTPHGNTAITTNLATVAQPAGTAAGQSYVLGGWNMWAYPNSTIALAITPKFATDSPGSSWSEQIQITPTAIGLKMGSAAAVMHGLTAAQQQQPHYVELWTKLIWQTVGNYWALFGYLYIDGVYSGSSAWYDPQHGYQIPQYTSSCAPVEVNVSVTTPAGAASPLSGTVQRISHTASGDGYEYAAVANTLEGRRQALDMIAAEINTAVYNGPLTTSTIGFPDVDNTSILDIFNDMVRTEAGHLFAKTTGSLSAAVECVEFRARDRPATVSASFDVTAEGTGLPSFVRDITNVAESVEVSGPDDTVIVADPTITGRYITTGQSETVLYDTDTDLRLWGQDRLYRGKNRAVRAQTFTIDAATTPTDRSTDLLALVPGDRISLTNTPAATLGFGSWDGWVLGGSESHTVTSNQFTFNLAPALPAAAVTDSTYLYDSGDDVVVTPAMTSTQTSLIATIIGATAATGTQLSTVTPYTIQIEQEQLTVTAVSGSTLTVTRGVNGTTASTHPSGAAIGAVPTPLYAY